MKWYKKDVETIYNELDSSATGIDVRRHGELLVKYGYNNLPKAKKESKIKRFLSQFNDTLTYILIAAALMTTFMQHYVDTVIIGVVIIINGLIGFIQENNAEKSLNGIANMLSTHATVIRDDENLEIEAEDLVPGDIVLLSPGDKVPADIRLLEVHDLMVEESALTGESTSVLKSADVIDEDVLLGDRLNMVYSGTVIHSGTAMGIVVATGIHTELGKINQMLDVVQKKKTPLIEQMEKINNQIFFFIVGLMVLLFVFAWIYHDYLLNDLVISIISLAVATVPEGLPAIMSITLSIGVQSMAAQHTIIRKLPTVETLGIMSVVCSDKTGTLTKNEMTAVTVILPHQIVDVNEDTIKQKDNVELQAFLNAIALCNDSTLKNDAGNISIIGDPTEGALLKLLYDADIAIDEMRLDKVPFDSEYKYMATLNEINGERMVYAKGAPDRFFDMCSYQISDNGLEPFDATYWEKQMEAHASVGLRILATAYKPVDAMQTVVDHKDMQTGMIFIGLVGIIDPPKPEAITAIQACHEAGIRVKMITGDHGTTALAIGRKIGLKNTSEAIEGQAIEVMTDDELRIAAMEYDVFARTSPEHKLRLVEALQAEGEIVGMTGDGVNDAPALKKANVGIAMGIKGTEVTKEAADMVLADDNFATIATAVKEGRRVYDNLKKTIYFILPTAFAQGLLIIIAILSGIELPLTPVQILWMNMVTTVTLSFVLALEPMEADVMTRMPRDAKARLLDGYAIWRIAFVAIYLAGAAFWLESFLSAYAVGQDVIRTMILQMIVMGQLAYMINCRETSTFSINRNMFRNKAVWVSIPLLLILQGLLIYLPIMNQVFATAPLNMMQIILTAAIGLCLFIIIEIEKFVMIKLNK